MKIAVTYENGNVFRHFGHSEAFKVYEVEDGKIMSAKVIDSDGAGHEALAGVLADQGIDVLICGGIGAGAVEALTEEGIEVCSGADGNADDAVEAFLAGELESNGVNCDHHEEEEGCGGHCEGCHGGCHTPLFEGKNVGKNCKVHYTGTFNDGTKFDSSYDRGETLDFVCGMGMMIPGFDRAVAEMEVGQEIDIHLMPEEAYGPADQSAIFEISIKDLPGSEDLNVGEKVYLASSMGQPFPVTVTAKDDENITLDANHEMAGKELNFHILLVAAE